MMYVLRPITVISLAGMGPGYAVWGLPGIAGAAVLMFVLLQMR